MAKLPKNFQKINTTVSVYTPGIPEITATLTDDDDAIIFSAPGIPGAGSVIVSYGETGDEETADITRDGTFTTPRFDAGATILYSAQAFTAGGRAGTASEQGSIDVYTPAFSSDTGDFDLNAANQADVAFEITHGTLDSISNGETPLVLDTDYTISEGALTILKEYLAIQSIGNVVLSAAFTNESIIDLTITVVDTTE